MRMLLSILITVSIGLKANAYSIDNDTTTQRAGIAEKREPFTAIIAASISAGASLTGTTVGALMAPGYRVAVSGSVENYSKWRLIYQSCTLERGYLNEPMTNVDPGKKEGFASHKADSSTAGSWVYCLYKVNRKRLHIMYSAPFNFDHYYNKMALAITGGTTNLNANNMYYNDYDYMDRKTYYNSVTPTEICREGICLKGSMGTSHQPQILIKLYPQSFDNIAPKIKEALEESPNAERQYKKFMKDEFNQ